MSVITGLIIAIVSVIYSYVQNQAAQKRFKKAQEEAEKRADQAKGFQLVTEATAAPLYIPYGRNIAGGARVFHAITSNVADIQPSGNGGVRFNNIGSFSGQKNEFLLFQQALCFGPLARIVDVEIDDQPWETYSGSVCLHVYPNGGIVDQMAAQTFPERADAVFNNVAYLTGVFRLNRDDPQFSGVPNVRVYTDGITVSVIDTNGVGGFWVGGKASSNNPVRCLLDYLMSTVYGKGLSADLIDLSSFYYAQQLCERVEVTNPSRSGIYWDNTSTTRDIKRFECNIALSTENTIRDNIEKLLESMDMAELIWTGGQYKLSLKYPLVYNGALPYGLNDVVQTMNQGTIDLYRSLANNNTSAVGSAYWVRDAASYISDDDILRDKEITVAWPNAKERYNKVSVKFRNESKGFIDDTVTWPNTSHPVYAQFMVEDGNVPLEADLYEEAITDYWHALARAEQRCRFSRIAASYRLTLTSIWTGLEPGDFVFLSSEVMKTYNALLRVGEVTINNDASITVDFTRYDASVLAWNATDSEYVNVASTTPNAISQVTNLRFSVTSDVMAANAGVVYWDAADDSRVSKYAVYATTEQIQHIDGGTGWTELGITGNTFFVIPSIPSGAYVIAVASMTSSGRRSKQFGIDGDRWTMVSVGIAGIISNGVSMYAATLYTRSSTQPAAPTGDVFDFGALSFATLPVGWSVTEPNGALPLYRSTGVVKSDGSSTNWSIPVLIPDTDTRLEVSRPVLPVEQDVFGNNIGYGSASGEAHTFANGINVTLDGTTNFTVANMYNVTAMIANVGASKGGYAVTSLVGNSGSFDIIAAFGGNTFTTTVSVKGLYSAYQVDLTPPPMPQNVVITVAMNTVFVDLGGNPNYTEGNGHKITEVWGIVDQTGTSTFQDAALIHSFTGTSTSFPSEFETPLYIWVAFRSIDGILGTEAGGVNGFDATTGLIGGQYIAAASIARAAIGVAAIDSLRVADGAITNAKIGQYIQSTNYVQGDNGWRIDKSGTAEFSGITIYDGVGGVLLSSGTGMDWAGISGSGKPHDGATRNIYRGSWAAGASYTVGDSVSDAGNSWGAVQSHTATTLNQPPQLPTTSNSYWTLVAAGGGVSAIAMLSNESHMVPATSAGVVTSLDGASTTVKVMLGLTDDTANWNIAATPVNITGSYSSSTKTYTVSAVNADVGYVEFNITRNGATPLVKRFTVTKSKAGDPGPTGSSGTSPLIKIESTAQAFTFTDSFAVPGTQLITLEAVTTNIAGGVSWVTTPNVQLGGSGAIRTLDLNQFGGRRQVVVTALADGVFDEVTIVRLDSSTAAAGATVGGTLGLNIDGQITSSNVSTYIANAAITNAQIGDLTFTKLKADDGTFIVDNGKVKAAYIDATNLDVRGQINVGNYTGYAWPAAGGTGMHMSSNGLLFGNPNPSAGNPGGKYFQMHAPAGGVPSIYTNIPAYIEDLSVSTIKIANGAITTLETQSLGDLPLNAYGSVVNIWVSHIPYGSSFLLSVGIYAGNTSTVDLYIDNNTLNVAGRIQLAQGVTAWTSVILTRTMSYITIRHNPAGGMHGITARLTYWKR